MSRAAAWGLLLALLWAAAAGAEPEPLASSARSGPVSAGVRVIACRRCAENLGVGERLDALGCEVVFTGELLTDWLQSGRPVLSI